MATEPNTPPQSDDDELLLDTPVDPPADGPNADDEGHEEEVPTFGDGTEPEDGDSGLVKHLRNELKEARREAAEARRSAPQTQKIEVGEKPTLAGCDYDEDKFEAELDAWKDRKAKAERQQQSTTQANEQEQQVWTERLQHYNAGKAKLTYADVSDAEENVKASLDPAQQAVLLMAADDPAKLTYALGKNADKLAALAAEKNPLKLAAQIARLEGQLKMVQRRRPPNPDTPERGSGKLSRETKDKTLAKLEAEADRTGDRTELVRYKRKLKDAGK